MRSFWIWIVLLTLIPITADATAVSVTIYGTNKSNAQTNVSCYGCDNTISVQAWNTSYVKNISVNSLNASGDVVSFNISNITGYQVQELKVNGTVVNGYQAGANGMLNFSYNITGNKTLVLSPALNANGYNFTWAYIWNKRAEYTFQNNTGRVINTVYRNTNSTARVISVGSSLLTGSYCRFYADAANPPTTRVAGQEETSVSTATFMVLPQHYYKADTDGTCALTPWIEWN